MLGATLRQLFQRDINRLKKEITLYKDEKNLWLVDKNISNSAGNLCLHLAGNLKNYFGAELAHTGYIRDRDKEFTQKNVSRADLLKSLDEAEYIVDQVLANISDEQLHAEYPALVFEMKTSTMFFLVHLVAHFSYHLGQVNYHRRLLDN